MIEPAPVFVLSVPTLTLRALSKALRKALCWVALSANVVGVLPALCQTRFCATGVVLVPLPITATVCLSVKSTSVNVKRPFAVSFRADPVTLDISARAPTLESFKPTLITGTSFVPVIVIANVLVLTPPLLSLISRV